MRFLDRREFLKDTAAITAALAGAGLLGDRLLAADEPKVAQKGGVNEELRIAIVGARGRGEAHVEGIAGKNNCIVATICDVDEAVIGDAMKKAETAQGKQPKYEKDIRRVLDDKSIDCISIATPNHWHALAAIWGLQ